MPDAEVQFGANTDDLVKGVNGAKSAIEGIDSSIQKVSDSGGALGAILVSAFSIAAIEEFARGMGKVADEVERVASVLGTNIPTTSLLSGIGSLTGTSLKEMQTILENINASANTATTDKFTQEAQAFRQLKIDADALTDTPVETWVRQLADAVAKLNPSLERSAIVAKIGGDALKNMMPTLEKGGDEYQRLAKIVIDSGAVMTAEQQQQFSSVKHNWDIFELSSKGSANTIYSYLTPAMNDIIGALTKMVDGFRKSVQAGGAAEQVLIALGWVGKGVAAAILSIVAAIELLAISANVVIKALTANNKEEIDKAVSYFKQELPKVIASYAEQMKALFGATGSRELTVNKKGGVDAEALDSDARRKARAEQEALEQQIAAARGAFEQEKVIQDARVQLSQMTATAGTRAVISAENNRYAIEKDTLEKEKAIWNEGSFEYERVKRRMVTAEQQHQTEILRLNKQMALQYKANWDEIFGGLQSAINGQLRGLLAGTTSFKQAFKAILGDMLIFFIQMVEKMVFQWLAGKLAMAAADKSEAASRIATDIAAREASLPIRVAAFTTDITAAAGLAFANTFAALAAFPPAAAAAGAASSATVLTQLAAVPKFELGSDYVPYTGLAMVHQGEKIIPASENAKGGGASVSVSINAWDAASVAAWLSSGGAALLAKHVSGAMNRNPSLRPKY